MRVDAMIVPRTTTVSGKLMACTEIRFTVTEDDGTTTHALTRYWDVIKNTPYNIGREIDSFLRRRRPGFYAAH